MHWEGILTEPRANKNPNTACFRCCTIGILSVALLPAWSDFCSLLRHFHVFFFCKFRFLRNDSLTAARSLARLLRKDLTMAPAVLERYCLMSTPTVLLHTWNQSCLFPKVNFACRRWVRMVLVLHSSIDIFRVERIFLGTRDYDCIARAVSPGLGRCRHQLLDLSVGFLFSC